MYPAGVEEGFGQLGGESYFGAVFLRRFCEQITEGRRREEILPKAGLPILVTFLARNPSSEGTEEIEEVPERHSVGLAVLPVNERHPAVGTYEQVPRPGVAVLENQWERPATTANLVDLQSQKTALVFRRLVDGLKTGNQFVESCCHLG